MMQDYGVLTDANNSLTIIELFVTAATVPFNVYWYSSVPAHYLNELHNFRAEKYRIPDWQLIF